MLQKPNHRWSRFPEGQEKMGSGGQEVGGDAASFQIVLPAPSLTVSCRKSAGSPGVTHI